MSYIDSNLGKDEQVLHRGRIHWAAALPMFVLGFFLLFAKGLGLIFIVLAFVALWIARASSELAVTNQRVMIKVGLISRRSLELKLAKVESVTVDQGLFGRLFGYGTITVTGTGGTKEPFKNIAKPMDFRRAVNDASEAATAAPAPALARVG